MIRIRVSGWVKWMVVALISLTPVLSRAQTDPGPVDMSNREAARIWFNTWWPKTYGAPMGFTGDVANGVAGDTSQAYKDEILLRLNIFRRMEGAQPVVFNAAYSAKDQQAALMMSANNALNHSPPTTWKFYTADGYSAANQSSLALGVSGPAAILGYLYDPGPSNTAVGHRIDMLWPPLTTMGTGDVPASGTYQAANALWQNDPSNISTNYRYDQALMCWPPKGYVPHYLITGRWNVASVDSFTTGDTDLRSVSVAVTKAGVLQSVKMTASFGEAVWTLDGTSEGSTNYVTIAINGESITGTKNETSDVLYHVSIDGIKLSPGGTPYNGGGIVNGHYEYDVTGYNADVATVIPGHQANLSNISTRSLSGDGSSTTIAGFIINGTAPRRILIRAGGPYLSQYGVDNVLLDPVLTLFSGGTQIATNDDWTTDAPLVASATTKVGANPFADGSKDSAIVAILLPGIAYTAHVSGKNGATGNSIVEIWDADDAAGSNLVNISTRSFVGTGSSIQIGGFILRGPGPRKVLIRAAGPYLSQFGVAGVLEDPTLTIFKGGTQIAQNDDWGANATEVSDATQTVRAIGLSSGSKDSAIVLTLDPDQAYTAQVSGKNGGTGNALIEIYQIP